VGDQGNCRLEDADWNDGLDMAHDHGESVAFTAVYAGNLLRLADILERMQEKLSLKDISLAQELDILLGPQAVGPEPLRRYQTRIKEGVTGKKTSWPVDALASNLRQKGEALARQVRENEWLKNSAGHAWFNGYYDNDGKRVEGDSPKGVRMTLTGQVFPIMSGVATNEQVTQAYAAVKRYLFDRKLGGFRLNTDFKEIQPRLGRAFSFAYGEKENGAFFSHMVVMFANALYQRGFVDEGYEVFSSLYRMSMNAEAAKIFPGLPEYFNGEGRGMYHYLTGSASWYLLTLVTQVLGIRGQWGDLILAPKLVPEQFGKSGQISAEVCFAGKRLKVTYLNRSRKPYGQYRIESALLQGRSLSIGEGHTLLISRQTLTSIAGTSVDITIALA
jgi:cellobiose phosphorylase